MRTSLGGAVGQLFDRLRQEPSVRSRLGETGGPRSRPINAPTVDLAIDGRPVSVDISPEARSCLGKLATPVVDNLHLTVRPVLFELCEPAAGEREPPIVDFDVAAPAICFPDGSASTVLPAV